MSDINSVVIFCAGRGTRLFPVTETLHKSLIKIDGKPIIQHGLDLITSHLPNVNIYVVVGHLANHFSFLEKEYPRLRLISNPQYFTTNNISSLFVSADKFMNTLYVEGDIFWKNDIFLSVIEIVKKSTDPIAFGSKMLRHGRETIYVLDQQDNVIETKYVDDAFNQNTWAGLLYVNKATGEEIQEKIGNYFSNKKNHQVYFEDFLWGLKNKFKYIGIDGNSYIEIDQLKDLFLANNTYASHQTTKLFTPGPTNIPEYLIGNLQKGIIHHRSSLAKFYIAKLMDGLRWLFGTKAATPFLLSSSATGALECAVVNFIKETDKILIISNGLFADRFNDIINEYLPKAEKRKKNFKNKPYKINELLEWIEWADVIVATMHETSNGYLNPISEFSAFIKNKILIVDTVSAVCFENIDFDKNNIDVAIASSSKGFMLPPGLSVLCASPKAIEKMQQVTNKRFYFDLRKYVKNITNNQTPFTPSIMQICAMNETIEYFQKIGLNNLRENTAKIYDYINDSLTKLGFVNLVNSKYRTKSMLSMKAPANIDTFKLREFCLLQHNCYFEIGNFIEKPEIKKSKLRIGIPFCIKYEDGVNLVNCIKEYILLQNEK